MPQTSEPAQPAHVRMPPLGVRELAHATVMPYRRGEAPGTWEMGVFDERGICVEETLIHHPRLDGKMKEVGVPATFDPAAREHAGVAVFLGPLLEHFGHFLLESLARLWYAKAHPDIPVAWSCRVGPGAPSRPDGPLSPWQRDMLELLRLENPAIFVDTPVRFEQLILPELGYRFRSAFHPEHAETLAVVPHRPEPGRKVWLSRGKLKRLQNLSMPEVEARLADLGWTILHPETLPFPQQIAEFAAAERVAGEQGSAFHSLIFLKDPEKLRVDIFLGDPTRRHNARNTNYDIIANAKRFDQRMHLVTSEVIVRQGKGFRVEKYSTDIDEYFEKLDLPVSKTGSPAGHDQGSPMLEKFAPLFAAAHQGNRPSLDDVARQFNTDKASLHRNREGKEVKGHGYADFYERYFREFRDEAITILELGCGMNWNIGASLRMLKAYFPKAHVIGVDNKRSALKLESEGFEIKVGDLSKIEFLRALRHYRPHILIDDASHIWSHQILAMAELYDVVPKGGVYVLEDINTSFGHLREAYSKGASFSGFDFVKAVCETMHAFDNEHLRDVPYPEYIRYVARLTMLVSQFRHTAVFVRG